MTSSQTVFIPDQQLIVYMHELSDRVIAAGVALEQLNDAWDSGRDNDVIAAMLHFFVDAGQVSKLIWPPAHRTRKGDPRRAAKLAYTVARGEAVRAALKGLDIALAENRKLRDNIEHLDEKMDAAHVDGTPPVHVKVIDPNKRTFQVFDAEVNVPELAHALDRVSSGVQDAIQRYEAGQPIRQ